MAAEEDALHRVGAAAGEHVLRGADGHHAEVVAILEALATG
jgi:hypothetical protein